MSFRLLSLAFATALVFVAGPASAARIIVTIDGLKNAQGNVFIGLYASPAKFLQGNQTDAQRRVKASTAPVTVMFDNLPAGTYAVGPRGRTAGFAPFRTLEDIGHPADECLDVRSHGPGISPKRLRRLADRS